MTHPNRTWTLCEILSKFNFAVKSYRPGNDSRYVQLDLGDMTFGKGFDIPMG